MKTKTLKKTEEIVYVSGMRAQKFSCMHTILGNIITSQQILFLQIYILLCHITTRHKHMTWIIQYEQHWKYTYIYLFYYLGIWTWIYVGKHKIDSVGQ